MPMVYASGARDGGMIGATGGGQIGAAISTSTNLLSQLIAPPPKKDPYLETALEVLGWFISIGFGLFLLPLALGIPLIVQGRKARREAKLYNETEWPGLYDEWSKRWLCMACGAEWIPEESLSEVHDEIRAEELPRPTAQQPTPAVVDVFASRPGRSGGMKLHEAIEEALRKAGRPLTPTELAKAINASGTYSKRDGSLIASSQIGARVRNYPHLFHKHGIAVGLVRWKDAPPTPPSEAHTAAAASPVTGTEGARVVASELEATLLDGNFQLAGIIDLQVPNRPGLYAIRIRDRSALPEPFASLSERRGHDLLYVGIARESLHRRFLGQELRARGHGTFFRSVGAMLGYRPRLGSLIGKGNTRNYTFAPTDEQATIGWMNANLLVNWVTLSGEHEAEELRLIRKHLPLLNLQGNPAALPELSALRAECVRIANTPV